MFYQIKLIRKKEKPPIWRRAYVPSNITFTQMALILEELLEFRKTDLFEFEFFKKKYRVAEWDKRGSGRADYNYNYLEASSTYVNGLFQSEHWFTFRIRDNVNQMPLEQPEYRVEVEKLISEITFTQNGEALNYPVLVLTKSPTLDLYWCKMEDVNDRLENFYFTE